MSENTTLTLHRAQQYLLTVLVMFSTFMLADMYKDWKEHLKEDMETKSMVLSNRESISRNTVTISNLSGRVEVLRDRINDVQIKQGY